MRLLMFGDQSPSGFGTVTMDLGVELLKLGLDVRFVSQNVNDDMREPFRSRTVDVRTWTVGPDVRDGHIGVTGLSAAVGGLLTGSAAVLMGDGSAYGAWQPDTALFLGDFDSVGITLLALDKHLTVPTWHYVPIEGIGLAPLLREYWQIAKPVAMSEFGAVQIERLMGERPPMIYHGVDTNAFAPVADKGILIMGRGNRMNVLRTREDCKRAWAPLLSENNGIPLPQVPLNWLLRTDRHMPRKRYNSLIRAVLPALARNPTWALVIHCLSYRDEGGDLDRQLSKVHPDLRRQVLLTRTGVLPRDLLCSLYNASDLYISNSAEGFGLTIAEALACGLPAVGARYSAVPEVIGPAGVTVPEGGLIDDNYDAFWWAADEVAFGTAVEDLMTHDTRRKQLGRLGPDHIRSTFRWDAAAVAFRDLMTAGVTA